MHLLTSHAPLPSEVLSAGTPHPLQIPIPLRQTIDAIIRLAHRPHKPAQGIHLVLVRVPPVLVHLADGDLHRGVVFGFDDAVGCAAFAGDVAVRWKEVVSSWVGCMAGDGRRVVWGRTDRRVRRVRSPLLLSRDLWCSGEVALCVNVVVSLRLCGEVDGFEA